MDILDTPGYGADGAATLKGARTGGGSRPENLIGLDQQRGGPRA